MTSTKLHSDKKNDFITLLKWTLSQNSVIILIYSIILFVFTCLINVWSLTSFFSSQNSYNGYLPYTIYSVSAVCPTLVSIVFVPIICSCVFRYMQNKRTVDFFGAMPVDRMTMFKARFSAGAVMTVAPILLCQIINFLLSLFALSYSSEIVTAMLGVMLFTVLSAFAAYCLCTMMFTCCGSELSSIISYLALSVVFPLVVLFLFLTFTTWIPGFMNSINFSPIIYTLFTPAVSSIICSLCYNFYCADSEAFNFSVKYSLSIENELILNILWLLVLSALTIFISIKIMKKRKMEAAGAGIVFALPVYLIRFLASFAGGYFLSFIFSSIISPDSHNFFFRLIWYIIGFLVGSFVVHLSLEAIFFKNLKGLAKSLIYYGFVIVSLALMFVFSSTGFFGRDIYVPKAEDVSSITVIVNKDSYNEKKFEYTSQENISDIIALHSSITDSLHKVYSYPYLGTANMYEQYYYYYNEDYDEEYNYWEIYDISIIYNLKNGGSLERNYDRDLVFLTDFNIINKYFHEFYNKDIYVE